MRTPVVVLLVTLALGAAAPGEIIDRTVAVVGAGVVTRSDVLLHLRVRAFLDGEPLDLSARQQRLALNRLIEQALIRREVELSRYVAPDMADVDSLVDRLRQPRLEKPEDYERELARYGISDEQVRQAVLWQLTLLRFIEYRFRPGVQVSEAEARAYYDKEFSPAARSKGQEVPPFEDARDSIESILTSTKVDESLNRWLEQAKTQVPIKLYKDDLP